MKKCSVPYYTLSESIVDIKRLLHSIIVELVVASKWLKWVWVLWSLPWMLDNTCSSHFLEKDQRSRTFPRIES